MCAKRKRMESTYESVARSVNRQSHDLGWKEIEIMIKTIGDDMKRGIGNEVPDDEVWDDDIT